MKNTFSLPAVVALHTMSMSAGAGTTYDGQTYADGTVAGGGSHDNIRVDYYDRAAIKVAVADLIYGKFVDSKTQKRNTGKTFRISRFLHILDDANNNNQGLDGEGEVIGDTAGLFLNTVYADLAAAAAAKAVYDATAEGIEAIANNVEPLAYEVVNGGGNLYGSSRNVGDVVTALPLLAEGADRVNRVGVTRENFSCTLVRQGNFEEYTDEVTMFSDHDMQMEYRTKLARLAIEVKDDNTQLGMLGAAGVRFYNTVVATPGLEDMGTADEDCRPTYDFFRKIVKRLKTNLAARNESMLTGSTKIGTTPINRAYYAIVHQDVVYDLEGIAEFRAVHEYGYASNLATNEIGSLHETRFLETTRAMKYAGAGAAVTTNPGQQATGGFYDVFPILYPTKGSYATVSLAGAGAIKFKSKAPGKATSSDPYGVKGLFSYNTWFAGLALQPEKLLVAYVTASE